jgi:tetratricopeptide (TPR) repeat protein
MKGSNMKKNPGTKGSFKATLSKVIPVFMFGALGGLVIGFTQKTSYEILIPFTNNYYIEIGVIGDLLIGGLAAIAILFFLSPLLSQSLNKAEWETKTWIAIISISVLAGFMGISLLSNLSSNLFAKLNKVETSVGNVSRRVRVVENLTEASIQIQEGVNKIDEAKLIKISKEDKEKLSLYKKDLLNEFGRISKKSGEDEISKIANNFINKETKYLHALLRFERALAIAHDFPKAMIEKAKVHRGLAQLYELVYPDEKKRQVSVAIKILNQVLIQDPNHSRALYNRACYYSLFYQELNKDSKIIFADLSHAIKLQPIYWNLCQTDSDFDNVREEQGFKRLLEELKTIYQ